MNGPEFVTSHQKNCELPGKLNGCGQQDVWVKMRVFWDKEPCNIAGVYRRFRRAYCGHNQGDELFIIHRPHDDRSTHF
jgi:hypothetical protein